MVPFTTTEAEIIVSPVGSFTVPLITRASAAMPIKSKADIAMVRSTEKFSFIKWILSCIKIKVNNLVAKLLKIDQFNVEKLTQIV